MQIAYFDETGDDGYPGYSSEIFVLTSLYMCQNHWKSNYEEMHKFRQTLKKEYGLPVKQEFHTKDFITDKNPYHGKFPSEKRREILFRYCELVTKMEIRIINVAINKLKINRPKYNVLKKFLSQRNSKTNRRSPAETFIRVILHTIGRYGFLYHTSICKSTIMQYPHSLGKKNPTGIVSRR